MQIVCHAPRRAMVIFSSLQRGSQREASGRKEGQSRSPERRGVSRFFANFDELNWKCKTLTTDEIVALVREGREERTDRIMASLDPFADIEDEGGVNDRSGC